MAFRNKSVDVHNFSMIPHAEIPRSGFRQQKALKTAFDAGDLVPILCEEVLPGDTFNVKLTAFCRTATPLFPVMDNLHLETFFFFVPNRLVWDNWQRFMGERDPNPDSSIDYVVPTLTMQHNTGVYVVGSIFDYFGLPIESEYVTASEMAHSVLPLRAYNLIWNEWFRDQNLQNSMTVNRGDAGDVHADFFLRKRGKRHDYFTSCLPWPQKGDAVSIGIGGLAPVLIPDTIIEGNSVKVGIIDDPDGARQIVSNTAGLGTTWGALAVNTTDLFADLSQTTAATINQLRQSFQVQRLLERDARGGTRYTEIIRAHFGVVSPDARLQRPEYLGGGHTMININPVAQTSAPSGEGTATPQAHLAAFGTALLSGHGFTQSFTEHGYIIGLANVRADLSYQQGLRRHWSRSTRYDFYFPVFAMLGEQAVLNKEIFFTGVEAQDDAVFGYQERWAEYRYNPSEITGPMRSVYAETIDAWHYAIEFDELPTLGDLFIADSAELAVGRSLAVQSANYQQILMDGFYDMRLARALPMYSVPGLIDHF